MTDLKTENYHVFDWLLPQQHNALSDEDINVCFSHGKCSNNLKSQPDSLRKYVRRRHVCIVTLDSLVF